MNKFFMLLFAGIAILEAVNGNWNGARIDVAMIMIIGLSERIELLRETQGLMLELLGKMIGVERGD